MASMNICARRPAPRRSDTNTRQAWVKPNDAWYSATPSSAPTIHNAPWRQLTVWFRYRAPASTSSSAIQSGLRLIWIGGSAEGRGRVEVLALMRESREFDKGKANGRVAAPVVVDKV